MGLPGKYFVTQPRGVNLVISCPHLLKAETVDEHRTLGAESVVIHEKGIACVVLFRVDCSFKGKLHLFSFSDTQHGIDSWNHCQLQCAVSNASSALPQVHKMESSTCVTGDIPVS